MKRVRCGQCGFTLIEILIVVAIIGLIAALIGPNLMGRFERSKEEIAKAQVEMLSSAVQAFMIDMRRYPNSLEELINSTDPQWRGHISRSGPSQKIPGGKTISSNALVITGRLTFSLSGLMGNSVKNRLRTGNHVIRTNSKRSIRCQRGGTQKGP